MDRKQTSPVNDLSKSLYSKPQLCEYGSIECVTRSVGKSGTVNDGGTGNNKTTK
jgi:hypothetical protein